MADPARVIAGLIPDRGLALAAGDPDRQWPDARSAGIHR